MKRLHILCIYAYVCMYVQLSRVTVTNTVVYIYYIVFFNVLPGPNELSLHRAVSLTTLMDFVLRASAGN